MSGAAVHASRTAAVWPRLRAGFRAALARTDLRRVIALGVAAGVFLGLIGPFGMNDAPIGVRVAYWVAAILTGTGVALVVGSAAAAVIDPAGARPYRLALATTLFMTPLAALLMLALTELFFPHRRLFGGFWGLIGPVFVVSLGMTGLNAVASSNRRPSAVVSEPTPPPVRFLDRLPPRLRGADLHAVVAEDHYLRLYTSKGSDLILMRLSDAIAELEGLDGAQTHRSWWVARAAVTEVRRGDGRATLVLTSGIEAPVSRSFAPELRSRGWY